MRCWFNSKAWGEGYVWFRLRYQMAKAPTKWLRFLSKSRTVLLLYSHSPKGVSRFHVGLPCELSNVGAQMAQDMGFSLRQEAEMMEMPASPKLTPTYKLPWHTSFMAELQNTSLKIWMKDKLETDGGGKEGHWYLPVSPPFGLQSQPDWSPFIAPMPQMNAGISNHHIGCAQNGKAVSTSGILKIYGEATVSWLVPFISHQLQRQTEGVVVLDGVGDLLPQLKRKPIISRQLRNNLAYADLTQTPVRHGFNPLAPIPNETEADTVKRWGQWFAGMGMSSVGLPFLEKAYRDGVADMPAFQQWLKRPVKQNDMTAISSVRWAVKRLLASDHTRAWLEWQTNLFPYLQDGNLLLAGDGKDWAQWQLLRAVLLAIQQLPDVCLVLHGVDLEEGEMPATTNIVTDGNLPCPSDAKLLVTSRAIQATPSLADGKTGGKWLQEYLQLLPKGTGLLIQDDRLVWTSWANP